jgi:hypothetical protein
LSKKRLPVENLYIVAEQAWSLRNNQLKGFSASIWTGKRAGAFAHQAMN